MENTRYLKASELAKAQDKALKSMADTLKDSMEFLTWVQNEGDKVSRIPKYYL